MCVVMAKRSSKPNTDSSNKALIGAPDTEPAPYFTTYLLVCGRVDGGDTELDLLARSYILTGKGYIDQDVGLETHG